MEEVSKAQGRVFLLVEPESLKGGIEGRGEDFILSPKN
jgi:hypothetical protein